MIKKIALLTVVAISTYNFNVQASEIKEAADQNPYPLKSAKGYSLAKLQEKEARIKYEWDHETGANFLNVDDKGSLKVSMNHRNKFENYINPYYSFLKDIIKVGCERVELEIYSKSDICTNIAYFVGKKYISAKTENSFFINLTLHSSDGPIVLTAKRFIFATSFADIKVGSTVIELRPLETIAYQPIEYIRFTPQASPVFMQGELDFEKLIIKNLIISHSDVVIKFKK